MTATITALAPWYGSNRTLAENVGVLMGQREWVGVPFAGGMCELAHIKARTMLVSDLHKHVINLARVVRDPKLGPMLYRRLRRVPFHPWVLDGAQRACKTYDPPENDAEAALNFAESYFICAWMTRSCTAGTNAELTAGISTRWSATGGDSAVRFNNAAKSLREWRKVLARCTFEVLDVFSFLDRVIDKPEHGLYLDPPFPGPGDKYTHKFSVADHRQLATALAEFENCHIVCRFYDHPLVRELYPEDRWTWHHLEGRKQTNASAPEVLLVNQPTRRELFA